MRIDTIHEGYYQNVREKVAKEVEIGGFEGKSGFFDF
jgi:hypothetical protein